MGESVDRAGNAVRLGYEKCTEVAWPVRGRRDVWLRAASSNSIPRISINERNQIWSGDLLATVMLSLQLSMRLKRSRWQDSREEDSLRCQPALLLGLGQKAMAEMPRIGVNCTANFGDAHGITV